MLPEGREPEIRVLPMPADTNAAGDVFGGWLMSQADIAGSISAYRVAGGRIVTIAVNDFRFLKPVFVGDLVSFYCEVSHIGTTSIRIIIEIYSQRERGHGDVVHVADAEISYVAIDENRNPRPIKDS